MTSWSELLLTTLHARFTATEEARLPPFKGATLRGSLGHALKELACLRSVGGLCDACLGRPLCAYGDVFEAPQGLRGDVILPYVVHPPVDPLEDYQEGDHLDLRVTLIGSARAWIPHVIYALDRMGWRGMGAGRGRWDLTGLAGEGSGGSLTSLLEPFDRWPMRTATDLVMEMPHFSRCRIEFLTPTELVRKERTTNCCDAVILVRRLVRRIGDLIVQHCGGHVDVDECKILSARGEEIRVEADETHLHAWERYSSRKDTSHGMRGIVGTAVLSNVPSELLPVLWIGQRLHVGKSAAFGMGMYSLEPLE